MNGTKDEGDLEGLEEVIPATAEDPLRIVVDNDEDPRIVTPTDEGGTRLKVNRKIGTCVRCGAEKVQTISAYDPAVYEGHACGPCILAGKAAPDHDVEAPIMRPMVFVAKALAGEEPYRTLIRAADEQRANPERAEEIGDIAKARLKAEKRLRQRGLVPEGPRAPRNRHERRLATKQAKQRNAKTKATARAKAAKDKANGAAQLDDFEAFVAGFE